MCRWFAYISPTEDCLLEDVLLTPKHAIAKQVNEHYLPLLFSHDPSTHAEPTTQSEVKTRNRLFNVDGFGMAYYTATRSDFCNLPSGLSSMPGPSLRPSLYKIARPCEHDANFQSLARNTSSSCVLAHIRAASTGVIVDVNNHPFVFGRHAIMHNGYISDYHSIAVQMAGLMAPEAYSSIKGRTDSEALAALYMTYLTAGSSATATQQEGQEKGTGEESWEKMYSTKEMYEALQNTVNTIIELQKVALGDKRTPNDLNVCVTDGRQLVACRFRNHKTEQPPSLYWSTSAGVTLNRKFPDHADGGDSPHGKPTRDLEGTHGVKVEGHNPYMTNENVKDHGKHVIVASEPTTYKECEWTLIAKNHAILVEADGTGCAKEVAYERDVGDVDFEG